jgi:hypothetical protein
MMHRLLERRARLMDDVSLQALTHEKAGWIPRLEVLAYALRLSHFEKMVIVRLALRYLRFRYVSAKHEGSDTRQHMKELCVVLSFSFQEQIQVKPAARVSLISTCGLSVCPEQAPNKYFRKESPLLREGLVSVVAMPTGKGVSSFSCSWRFHVYRCHDCQHCRQGIDSVVILDEKLGDFILGFGASNNTVSPHCDPLSVDIRRPVAHVR